ncbi:hypothetical protein ACFPLB_04135 [Aquamicrobium segne]|uniref:Uncharacterized protein n=1 Tax=Aquamicrobium segne TaxID=469547 RepID=A0ABW0GXE4_9HYPH
MTDARERFIQKLLNTADNIGDVPKSELAILLRQAAIWLRNAPRDEELEDEFSRFISDMNNDDDPGGAA